MSKIYVLTSLIKNADCDDDINKLFCCCAASPSDMSKAIQIQEMCGYEVVDRVPANYFILTSHLDSNGYVLFGEGMQHDRGHILYNINTETLKAVKLEEDEFTILTDAAEIGMMCANDMLKARKLKIGSLQQGYPSRMTNPSYIRYLVSLAALPILKRITE